MDTEFKENSLKPNLKEPANPGTKEEIKKPDETNIEGLFEARDIETLLQQKNNPDAQLAALVLMSNAYRNFVLLNDNWIKWLASVDIDLISQILGLDETARASIKKNRSTYMHACNEYKELSDRYRNAEKLPERTYDDDAKKQHRELLQTLQTQQCQLKSLISKSFRKLMLPVRKAVLTSETLPEKFKLHVVEGIKGYDKADEVSKEENELLKNYYPEASDRVREQIAKTVMFKIRYDINSFDVIPPDDLKTLGINLDEMFIAILGNPQTTSDFVEKRVAPVFFPTEDPAKVRKCWEALRSVIDLKNLPRNTIFAPDGYNSYTHPMNIAFRNFMENSDELIPVINVLSGHGFNYFPINPINGKFYPEYITRLKELGESINELQAELDTIRAIIPDYQYSFIVKTRYSETKAVPEPYIEDNPFSIALNQKINPYGLETDERFNQAIQLFELLKKVVSERWRSGFIATYIDIMTKAALCKNHPKNITNRAIIEARKYVLDSDLLPEDVELFATNFFEASLDPKNDNVESAFEFCEKYADKVRTFRDGSRRVDADSTWFNFSLIVSDIYRYPITPDNENEAVEKTKRNMRYAIRAIYLIKDPVIRDKAISNLIYGLTDEEVGDLETAQILASMIENDSLREDAEEEIKLEIRRVAKGESTAWKKMEKVRQSARENEEFIKNLFGFGSPEGLQEAQAQYYARTSTLPDIYVYSDRRKAQLEEEVKRIKDNFYVTVNMTWENVLKVLENGRVLSVWENPEVMAYRNKMGTYPYETRRNEIERMMGNRAKGGMKDPHPIYGAAASPNGRDEFYGGTGGAYGECFLVLKTENIKNRTSFCYDDSFSPYGHWPLDWDGGITAKAIHNLLINEGASIHGYVEAQILGGVTLDDIEAIYIPSDAIRENKYGWSAGTNVFSQIEELRKKYPHIKINIIEVPNQQT